MVIGFLKVEETTKVKNNPFYGNYEAKSVYTRTLVNEKYEGLVAPKNGIHITLLGENGEPDVDFYIGKYYITGEPENEVDKDTEFSTSFTYGGNVYEITVDGNGQLVSFDRWLNAGEFEDDCNPDEHYTKRSSKKHIKWELIDM